MDLLLNLVVGILVLGVIILIHELGHFIFARKADILCHEFSIGMGPVVYQKRKGEIVYSVRAIPLGGYVSMAGEDLGDILERGKNIGINLDSNNNVKNFVLYNNTSYDKIGKIVDFDLSGIDDKPYYLDLLVDSAVIKYNVNVDATYLLAPKKEMWIAPYSRNYDSKTLWQRFKVIFAGPAANFLLAFFLVFVLAFFVGKPVNANKVGKVDPTFNTYNNINKGDTVTHINSIETNSWNDIGKQIYLNKNDTASFTINNKDEKVYLLVAIQGLGFSNEVGNESLVIGNVFGRTKDLEISDQITGILYSDESNLESPDFHNVSNWNEIISYIEDDNLKNKSKEYVYISILRNNEEKIISYKNIYEETLIDLGSPYIGYSAGFAQPKQFNIFYPFYYPFKVIGSNVSEMFTTLKLLFVPKTGVGISDLSGPVGIFSMINNARKNGIEQFLLFVAFISVNIGILNLLPVPALDGGRLVFIAYEAITKKKVNKKVENTLITITFLLLFALMIFVTFGDVLRLF